MSCRIVSVTSYLSKNEAKNLQNGDVNLAQIPYFEMGYLENHLRIEVSDGSFFLHFHALSFELNFFDRSIPLRSGGHYRMTQTYQRFPRVLIISDFELYHQDLESP